MPVTEKFCPLSEDFSERLPNDCLRFPEPGRQIGDPGWFAGPGQFAEPGLLADPGLIAEPGRFADPGRFGEPGLLEEYTGEDGVFPRAPWELKGARDIIRVVLPPELNMLSRWALFFALDMRPNIPSGRGTAPVFIGLFLYATCMAS